MPDQMTGFLILSVLFVCVAVVAIGVSNFADHCASVCGGKTEAEDRERWLTHKQRAFAVVVTSLIFAIVFLSLAVGSLLFDFLEAP